jgi:predicted DNA-binding transcriptional regulator AlpA
MTAVVSLLPAPINQLLRPIEAAKLLAISPRTLWGLTKDNQIPHLRINRVLRYDINALQQWIASHLSGIQNRKE